MIRWFCKLAAVRVRRSSDDGDRRRRRPPCHGAMRWRMVAAWTLAAGFAAPHEAIAQFGVLYDWIDPLGGSFDVANNWTSPLTAPPGSGDTARFALDAIYTVNFPTDVATGGVRATDGRVTFNLDISGMERLLEVDSLRVTGASDPELILEGGRVDATEILVQDSGLLRVGSDAWLLAFGDFTVDGGDFFVNDGGEFGLIGPEAIVQNGGNFVHSPAEFVLGGDTFRVESDGLAQFAGALRITGGGALRVDGAGSSVVIAADSTWATVTQDATVELLHGGALIIAGDLRLSDGTNGADATLTIDGAGSSLTQTGGSLFIGDGSGSAVVNLGDGGALVADVGVNLNATGQLNLQPGGLLDAETVDVNGGAFNFLGGELRFNTFDTNLVNANGTVAPGRSVGDADVVGNYTQQAAATLDVQIGGILPGQWDRLDVSGNAILDGVLEVSLVDGFVPVAGNSFPVLETIFGNVSGQFDAIVAPVFDGLTFQATYDADSVVLEVVEATFLEADFDEDGDVDGDDLTQWRGDFGVNDLSDADNDGDSDGADFLVWQRQLGSMPVTPTAGAVPEPAAWTLAGLVLLGGLFSRRC
jgi:hypothetical protein